MIQGSKISVETAPVKFAKVFAGGSLAAQGTLKSGKYLLKTDQVAPTRIATA